MEPTEINGGRFYARPLHNDERIDDSPALQLVDAHLTVDEARTAWDHDTIYTWAVCEQTNVDMIALAALHITDTATILDIAPVGDPNRKLPNDPVLTPKTVGDAVTEIRGPITRWCTAHGINISN